MLGEHNLELESGQRRGRKLGGDSLGQLAAGHHRQAEAGHVPILHRLLGEVLEAFEGGLGHRGLVVAAGELESDTLAELHRRLPRYTTALRQRAPSSAPRP